MKRYFESLRPADPSTTADSVPDGLNLVRVVRARFRWHRRNPFYEVRFVVLKPKHLIGTLIASRLDCSPKAMWKLSWFLREFGYEPELLKRGEIDDQALVDLWGVASSEVSDQACGSYTPRSLLCLSAHLVRSLEVGSSFRSE